MASCIRAGGSWVRDEARLSDVDEWTLRASLSDADRQRVDDAWRHPGELVGDGVLAAVGHARATRMRRLWARWTAYWIGWDVLWLLATGADGSYHRTIAGLVFVGAVLVSVGTWRRAARSVEVLRRSADLHAAAARAVALRAAQHGVGGRTARSATA